MSAPDGSDSSATVRVPQPQPMTKPRPAWRLEPGLIDLKESS